MTLVFRGSALTLCTLLPWSIMILVAPAARSVRLGPNGKHRASSPDVKEDVGGLTMAGHSEPAGKPKAWVWCAATWSPEQTTSTTTTADAESCSRHVQFTYWHRPTLRHMTRTHCVHQTGESTVFIHYNQLQPAWLLIKTAEPHVKVCVWMTRLLIRAGEWWKVWGGGGGKAERTWHTSEIPLPIIISFLRKHHTRPCSDDVEFS